MIYVIWFLRIVHIVAGIFWVGSAVTLAFFVSPTIAATGEAGQKFMGHLMNQMKFSSRVSIAAGLTILAGFFLYWIDSQAFTSPWMSSGAGRGFAIGAVFALVGLVFGIRIGRTARAMAELGAQITGQPSTEQMARLQDLRLRQARNSQINVAALMLATIFMAIARYL